MFIWIALPLRAEAGAVPERLGAGGRHITDGRPANAIAALEGALAEYREEKNLTGEAVTLMLMAIAERHRSLDDAARSHLQNALHIVRERKDAIGTWLALLHLAQMERSRGNYGAALNWQDEAQSVIEKAEASDSPLMLATFELMATALGLPSMDWSGGPTGAGEYLQAIALEAIVKPLTQNSHAGILIEVGQYDRAEKALSAVLAGPALFSGGYQASVAAHFGELRYRQRRFAEARVHYEKALHGSPRMPLNPLNEQWIKAGIHSRLAELEIAQNHIGEALAWNDKSLAAIRSAQIPLESSILEERGLLLLRGDRLPEAETAFRQALGIAIANDDSSRRASIESHLADLSFLMGRYGTAIRHLEEAIRQQQFLHHRAAEGLLWANLAICYILMSEDDSADILLAQAHELARTTDVAIVRDITTFLQVVQGFRKGTITKEELRDVFEHLIATPQFRNMDIHGDAERVLRESMLIAAANTPDAEPQRPMTLSAYASLAYSNMGWRQLHNGHTTAARHFFEKALNANATGELRARYHAAIGACHWRDGNIDQAIRSFNEAADTLDTVVDDLQAESMLVSFLGSKDHRAYYDVLIEALLREHHDEKAFEITERARSRGFLRLMNGRPAIFATSGSLAEKAQELRLQIENWDTLPVTGETRDNLRLRYDLLRSRIQATTSNGPSTDGVQPLSLADVWQELPDHTTLISYFVSSLGAHAWVLDRESVEHVTLDLDAGRMKRVTCWAAQFAKEEMAPGAQRSARVPGDCGSDSARSEEVYATLFAPLRSRIRNSRVMIVPHGDLHDVPFAALLDPHRKRYLVEDYTFTHLPSASAVRLLRARESPVLGRSLVLGDPDAAGPTSLPGANREVQLVATMLSTDAKIGKEAAENLVYNLDGKVDLLHIAAHGAYDRSDPSFSAIELAGSDNRNGQLTVDELLSDIDLSGVNLVVLSACQSGVGKRTGGDDVISLTRALLYAGSPGVISTLWSINDKATTFLIKEFYSRLLGGSTAADALRAAQLRMLRDARFRAPYYWAAFFLAGDPLGKWTTLSR
ncbi:MAG TPA: CHAT domain-containing protein [Thermoanaerobaculia bacterium]|nr:CHAT domain-containing protein [Thermoanaerobaculia bacterium]